MRESSSFDSLYESEIGINMDVHICPFLVMHFFWFQRKEFVLKDIKGKCMDINVSIVSEFKETRHYLNMEVYICDAL